MVAPILRACRKCSRITELDVCPYCNEPTSRDWQGYVIINDYEKSEIAAKMNIRSNGKYALRVR
ncbi:MAG: DNA-directed RNA polymerase subunit E [Candidatus Methanomethylophilaceae archaeon]|jgi:DNA-directed RNA polymerase subunit E"|nr:DNA-directed RNA polymerase subunit E [Candidatus Methanomethylophilaceae archaeon]